MSLKVESSTPSYATQNFLHDQSVTPLYENQLAHLAIHPNPQSSITCHMPAGDSRIPEQQRHRTDHTQLLQTLIPVRENASQPEKITAPPTKSKEINAPQTNIASSLITVEAQNVSEEISLKSQSFSSLLKNKDKEAVAKTSIPIVMSPDQIIAMDVAKVHETISDKFSNLDNLFYPDQMEVSEQLELSGESMATDLGLEPSANTEEIRNAFADNPPNSESQLFDSENEYYNHSIAAFRLPQNASWDEVFNARAQHEILNNSRIDLAQELGLSRTATSQAIAQRFEKKLQDPRFEPGPAATRYAQLTDEIFQLSDNADWQTVFAARMGYEASLKK